ncbi:hypothetical protein LJK88_33700 [Paenibacillus sp. P26]|nr:hypothetical protein LJK88_33700 [Paenibacillus sp. P26]
MARLKHLPDLLSVLGEHDEQRNDHGEVADFAAVHEEAEGDEQCHQNGDDQHAVQKNGTVGSGNKLRERQDRGLHLSIRASYSYYSKRIFDP